MNKEILAVTLSVVLLVGLMPLSAFSQPNNEHAKVTILPDGTRIIEKGLHKAIAKPKYTTITDPGPFEALPTDHPTVAKLYLNNGPTYLCTGVLIDPQWILTAAHCVTNTNNGKLSLKSGTAYLGGETHSITTAKIKSDWTGNYLYGNDIALLKLQGSGSSITPAEIDSTTDDDLGAEMDKVGYGRSGLGSTGATTSAGTLHAGQNIYDSEHDTFWDVFGYNYLPKGALMYDFDDGGDAHDAFYTHFGIKNINNNNYDDEVNSASGDSGGPTFDSNGKVVGITSYGLSATIGGEKTDIDGSVNSSFGEYSGDTAVAVHYDWIISIIGGDDPPVDEEPIDEEPNCPPNSKSPKCR